MSATTFAAINEILEIAIYVTVLLWILFERIIARLEKNRRKP